MNATAIYRRLYSAGVCLSMDGDMLLAAPTRALDDELRWLIRENKPALVRLFREAHETTEELLALADRACVVHRDDPVAREQMRLEVIATPVHLRVDLLAHFEQAYGNDLNGRASPKRGPVYPQAGPSPNDASEDRGSHP